MTFKERVAQAVKAAPFAMGDAHGTFTLADVFDDAFSKGAEFGFDMAVELLKGMPNIQGTRPTFGQELATWLEGQKK